MGVVTDAGGLATGLVHEPGGALLGVGLVLLGLVGQVEALLDAPSALVQHGVEPGQGEAAHHQEDEQEDDRRPEDLVERGQDEGSASYLPALGSQGKHHLTTSGRTKPMRPRASTMPAPMIMLVNRRPATSG